MQVVPGMMVTANVRLERPLGEGAMGAVWVADHLTLKTEVAVKFISSELAGDPAILARFTQEASVAAQIKSPHVVQTFDQGVMPDGTPYIVMELLEGESLQEQLEHSGWLSLAEAATVITQVARALNRAHEIGVVHRDIKPDNIFITPGDDGPFCKILDFGIAKQTSLPQMGGLTNPGIMVGTPEYMSPEQVLSAKDVDYRADLWGLAVTMYHALTGQLPFTAEALGTLCVKLLDGKFTPPSKLRPALPSALDGWFATAMAHEPAERFGSAREMAQSFVQIVAGAGGYAPTASLDGFTPPPGALAGSVDTTAPLPAPLAPPSAPHPQPLHSARHAAPSSPDAAPRVAESQTLTGSSSNRRRDTGAPRWALGLGGVALVAAVTAIVLTVSSSDEIAGARDPAVGSDSGVVADSDEPESPPVEPLTTAEPSASASASAPEHAATPSETSAPTETTASAAVPPAVPASPPPPPVTKPPKPKTDSDDSWDHGF